MVRRRPARGRRCLGGDRAARGEPDRLCRSLGRGGIRASVLWPGWNFGRLWPKSFSFPPQWLRSRPKLRVHSPDGDEDQPDGALTEEVDRILEKISHEGESSLTRKERRTLETASRQYQKRRQDSNDRVR